MLDPLYIRRVGSVYFDADDDTTLTDLKPLLRQHCTRRYRRIDRFTQLALIGAARCARDVPLPPDTPVYLASGKGPASNNLAMQETIIRDGEPPMPVQFINAVSNSVGFYVMQDHALSGQGLFLSREIHAFEAALRLVAVDLALLPSTTALLGVVDEITQPLSAQRARLGLAEDVLLGEGSHWFLLSSERSEQTLATLLENRMFSDLAALQAWLKQFDARCHVFFGQGMDLQSRKQSTEILSGQVEFEPQRERLWDGLNAGAISHFLQQGLQQEESVADFASDLLLVISCDSARRFHVTLTQKTVSPVG